MSLMICIITARTGRPTLTVRGTDKAEVFNVASRVNAWLAKVVPGFSPYTCPAYRDKFSQALFYSPTPIATGSDHSTPIHVEVIAKLINQIKKAGIEFDLHVGDPRYAEILQYMYPYTPSVKVEVLADDEDVVARPVSQPMQLGGDVATNAQLKAHLKAQGKKATGNKADLLARL